MLSSLGEALESALFDPVSGPESRMAAKTGRRFLFASRKV